MLRLAYLGLPLGAHVLAAHGFAPVVIGTWHTDAIGMRRIRRRLARDGRTLVLGQPDLARSEVRALIASARPDALLSWFHPRLIPEELLAVAPRGAFGVHPSLLPRWRGPDPYFWAIRAGDLETGVTLHRLAAEYDTGAIIASTPVPIRDDDDAWTLARRLDRPSLSLLVTCAERLARGEELAGTQQDDSLATPAPRPSEEELVIPFDTPALNVVRLVRAAAPFPGATCTIGDTLVSVLRARVVANVPRALQPGEAMVRDSEVVVRTLDEGVAIERVRIEEGSEGELRGAAIATLLA